MTEKFKEELLNYLTGKINISSQPNEPQFLTPINIGNDLYTYISQRAVQPVTGAYKIIKGKNTNNQYLDYQLLVGIDNDDDSSFMVILDRGYNPLQFINSYSSGTKFGVFEQLIVDDDGRFYGVEYQNNTRRFVMLNNILVKTTTQTEYKVVLRQSYNLPNSLQNGTINSLIKKPLGNKYLFCATTTSNHPLLVEFTINVGEPNVWTEYTNTDNHCSVAGAWASWDNDNNLTYKIVATYTSGMTGYLYIFCNDNGTMILNKQFNLPEPTASWIQATILNFNNVYLSYCDTVNGVYNQYVYKVDNNLTQIFVSDNEDSVPTSYLLTSTLYNDGINVYVSYNLPKLNDELEYHMGIIYNDILYDNIFGTLEYTTSQSLFVTNTFHQFNLYSYYLQLGDMAYVSFSIFNNFYYNGVAYDNINGLNPNSAVLYASYHIPIFARNLYNKTINDNTTVSTVEIPNNMLNAVNIQEQELFSQTNNELVDNVELYITNIYETLNINFYNTINMLDENEEEVKNRIQGAIKLNASISRSNDYYNTQATKVRINYTDNTNYIMALDPDTQISLNDSVMTYSFMIYVPTGKTITNLQIISYDEQVVYAEINGSFTQGKYYTITQDVYVE